MTNRTDSLDDLADAIMDLPISDISSIFSSLTDLLPEGDIAHLRFRLPMLP